MQKLLTTLDTESYYDDELKELYHQHDDLHAKYDKSCSHYHLRLQELHETAQRGEARTQSSASSRRAAGGSAGLRQRLAGLARRLTAAPAMPPPAPTIAERVAQEVNAMVEPRFDLLSTRTRLHAFYARRREGLALQCDMLASRMQRFARDWMVAQRAAPALATRMRTLEKEIEAADSRMCRLRPSRRTSGSHPVGRASTGSDLFKHSQAWTDGTRSCVFRTDIVVCLRDQVTEERVTRALRRFLQRMQHLPVTHREELWHRARCLAPSWEGSPMPLLAVADSPSLRRRLQELAEDAGCRAMLRADEGHTFARRVVTDFPVVFDTQRRQMRFRPYPAVPPKPAEEEGAAQEEYPEAEVGLRDADAGPVLKTDDWVPCALLHTPRVDLISVEQRAIMANSLAPTVSPASPRTPKRSARSPKARSPRAADAPDSGLAQALDFLRQEDPKAVEERLSSLAQERAQRASAAAGDPDPAEDRPVAAPEQLLRAYYLLRHLRSRALRRKLLGLLNLYRYAQQKVAHGALAMQARKETTQSGEATFDGDFRESVEPPRDADAPPSAAPAPGAGVWQPPSLCSGASFPHPGALPRPATEALEVLSDQECLLPSGPAGVSAVVDGHGLVIMHSAAIADLEVLEQEILTIGSYVVSRASPQQVEQLDHAAIIADLLEAEVALHESKWQLLQPLLEAYELVADVTARRDVGQRIVDVMAQRPRFDLKAAYVVDAYAAAAAAMEQRAQLLRVVLSHQLRLEAEVALRHARPQEPVTWSWHRAKESKGGGGTTREDPQLSLTEGLAHDREGFLLERGVSDITVVFAPTARGDARELDILDFCSSAGLCFQVDLLVEQAAEQLAETLAPELSRRYELQAACAAALAETWRADCAATSRGDASGAGVAADGLVEAAIDDPAHLMLIVEDVVGHMRRAADARAAAEVAPPPVLRRELTTAMSIHTEASDAGGIDRDVLVELLADEHEKMTLDEAALSVFARLLEQVTLRRRLGDVVQEVGALTAGLARQGDFVGAVASHRGDPIPEFASLHDRTEMGLTGGLMLDASLNSTAGASTANLLATVPGRRAPVLAADVDPAFAEMDFSSRAGVLMYCQSLRLRELRLVLQHELANRWLYAACAVHNSLLLDDAIRELPVPAQAPPRPPSVARLFGSLRVACGLVLEGAPHAARVGGAQAASVGSPRQALLKQISAACEFPGPMKGDIWSAVGAALRDRGRAFRKQCNDHFNDPVVRRHALRSFRHRFLTYCSLFVAERACDLLVRIQAAQSMSGLRDVAVMIPQELSPYVFSTEDQRHGMVRDDGVLQNLFALPRTPELLCQRGTGFNLTSFINDWEAGLPETVGGRAAASFESPDLLPLLRVNYYGAAYMTLLLVQELAPLASLLFFFSGVGGDRQLILKLHHAAAGNRHDASVAKKAVAEVLNLGMLGPVQMEDMERVKPPVTPEQATWDALQGMGTEYNRLRTHLRALTDASSDPQAVAALLARRRLCATMRASLLLRQLGRASLGQGALEEAAEVVRWAQYLEGFPADGGSGVLVPGAIPVRGLAMNPPKEEGDAAACHARATLLVPPLQPGAQGLRAFGSAGDEADDFASRVEVADDAVLAGLHPLLGTFVGIFTMGAISRLSCGLSQPSTGQQRERGRGAWGTVSRLCDLRQSSSAWAPWRMPAVPTQAVTRALCLVGPEQRLRARDLHLRLEMLSDRYLQVRQVDPDSVGAVDVESELSQVQICTDRLQEVALCLLLQRSPPRSREEQLHFDAVFAERFVIPPDKDEGEEGEEEGGDEQPAGERRRSVRAAVPAEETEEDRAKAEVQRSYSLLALTVASIMKSVLRFAVGGLQRQCDASRKRVTSRGGQAVLRFADRLGARGAFVSTSAKPEDGAWVVKERDLRESVAELGRTAMQWACRSSDEQLVGARSRVAASAALARRLQQRLVELRLVQRSSGEERRARLAALVAEQGRRQLYEVDRLHRVLGDISSASFELEHRLGAEIRQGVLRDLAAVEAQLASTRAVQPAYRQEMRSNVQGELRRLRQTLMQQLRKMEPHSYALQQRVKAMQDDPEWTGKEEKPLGEGAKPMRPAEVQVVSASGHQDPEHPLEELHAEIKMLQKANSRFRTIYHINFKDIRAILEHELNKLSSNLSSNGELWQSVSEVRERQHVVDEELRRVKRRREVAASSIDELNAELVGEIQACENLGTQKEKLAKAQKVLESEMSKYQREGAVDVRKMESDLMKLEQRLKSLRTASGVKVEELISARESRAKAEQRRMRMQMLKEGAMMNKASAKANLIRMELERGHDDREESLTKLMHDEVQELTQRASEMAQENQRLREALAGGPPSRPGKKAAAAVGATKFEEDLCYSVSLMMPTQSRWGQKSIDQSLSGAALPEIRSSSEPPRLTDGVDRRVRFVTRRNAGRRETRHDTMVSQASGVARSALGGTGGAIAGLAPASANAMVAQRSLMVPRGSLGGTAGAPRPPMMPSGSMSARGPGGGAPSTQPRAQTGSQTPRDRNGGASSGSASRASAAAPLQRKPTLTMQPSAGGTSGTGGQMQHLSPVSSYGALPR